MTSKREIMAGVESDPGSSRLWKRNTARYTVGGRLHVRFHHTTIYEATDTGFIVRTGGWHTVTTEWRINLALKDGGPTKWRAWRVSKGWHYAQIYLVSESQMVPVGNELQVVDGQMEERSCHFDQIFRSYWHMRWTHSYGTKHHPNDVEWDGRASTLRRMLVAGWYSDNRLPWRFLNRFPGLKMEFTQELDYRWQDRKYVMTCRLRYKCVSHKIRMRDLFMRILEKGHVDKI